jgi:hypothetical protein
MLDLTTSDSRPDRELVIASGKLNVKNSMSASGLSIRNGTTIRRVAVAPSPLAFADSTGMRKR